MTFMIDQAGPGYGAASGRLPTGSAPAAAGAQICRSFALLGFALYALAAPIFAGAAQLADVIATLRPGVVAIGTMQPARQPRHQLRGTGFVVADGNLVVTNGHVIPPLLNAAARETLSVFSGHGRQMQTHDAEVVARDEVHDLAVLKIKPGRLQALTLSNGAELREGEEIAFTGFPVVNVLGLYHATHRGIVASITPVVIPVGNARELTAQQIALLRDPYMVVQLDATAYPGNSGSPLYRVDDGEVVGIVNAVLLKGTRENALKDPSNITYAIPVAHIKALLTRLD